MNRGKSVFLVGLVMLGAAVAISLVAPIDSNGVPHYVFYNSLAVEQALNATVLTASALVWYGWRTSGKYWSSTNGMISGFAIFLASGILFLVTLFYPYVTVQTPDGTYYVGVLTGQPFLGVEFGAMLTIMALIGRRFDRKVQGREAKPLPVF